MKELIKALHTIQDECKKHQNRENGWNCENCPMFVNACGITDTSPDSWTINDEVQKALL